MAFQLPGDIHRLISDILSSTDRYSIKDIVSYCKTSREINQAVCNDRRYWLQRAAVLSNDRELLNTKSLSDLKKALFLFEKRRPDPVYFAKEGYEKAVEKALTHRTSKRIFYIAIEEAARNGHPDLAREIIVIARKLNKQLERPAEDLL